MIRKIISIILLLSFIFYTSCASVVSKVQVKKSEYDDIKTTERIYVTTEADIKALEPIKNEVNLSVSPFPGVMIGVSRYFIYGSGVEVSLFVEPEDMVILGNFILAPTIRYGINPFLTIGLGKCKHDALILNGGGGVKIRLTEKLGIRADLRYYEASDVSGLIFLGGVSYFF